MILSVLVNPLQGTGQKQVRQDSIIQTCPRKLKDMNRVGAETLVILQRKGCLGKFAPIPPAGYHLNGSYPNRTEAVPT